jgi:uncharacterized protein (TIGR03435 family)
VKAHVLSAVGIVALAGGIAAVAAQTPASPAFDVVSIKPLAPGRMPVAAGFYQLQLGGRFRGVGLTASGLVTLAFRMDNVPLRPSQIVGGPNWMATSQYDIVATTGADISAEVFAARLPSLVRSVPEDRFKLKAHAEMRPVPVYVLVRLRENGRFGPQLRPSSTVCQVAEQNRTNVVPPITPPPPSIERPTCSLRLLKGSLVAGSVTIASLAGAFTKGAVLDRIVLDRTGLTGRFDIDLQWSPEQVRMGVSADGQATLPPLQAGPSLFTAVQEQLGLKLESRREPMDMLVIDHVERPTEN